MDKILKFKQEVLDLKIYSQIDYYPGNPYYIGKSDNERLKKSIEESSYKDFISEKNQSLYEELTSNEPVSQYYVELADEAAFFDLFEEALHSTDNFSIDDLKVAFDLLASYEYDAFLEELDLLNHNFLNAETTKEDEHRLKTTLRKQFGYSIPRDGKITAVFVSDLRKEMKMRVENLGALKEMIEKVIDIKNENESSAFARSIGLEFSPNNDPEIKSLIDYSIERRQVRPLFEFIDFLYFNKAEFIGYNTFVGEYERLKMDREKMSSSNNYKALIAKKEIDHKIEMKKVWIHRNITQPIKNKSKYLGIYDILKNDSDSDSDCESDMSGIDRQIEHFSSEAPKLVQLYEERYVEFREVTNYNKYDCFDLFDGVDNILEPLFSFFSKSGETKLIVSKNKHLEGIRSSSIKPLTITGLQSESHSPHPTTASNINNNDKPINNNPMDINFEAIFEIALTYADDPEEMKEFCMREQRKAEKAHEYIDKSFYKGLLKVVADKKERAKYQPKPGPTPTRIGSFFIAGGGGSGYDYKSIELLEQIINELSNEGSVQRLEQTNKDKPEEDTRSHASHVPQNISRGIKEELEISEILTLKEKHPVSITTNPPSLDIPLSDDELLKHFNELVKGGSRILHHKTDYHHFAYAISGHALPKEKQPYQVIKLCDYNNRFYYYLNEEIVQGKLKRQQKCLPNLYRKKAKRLFYNKNGKPLKLSNPT